MGLFDLFSNDTAEEAARKANAGLQSGYDAQSALDEQGRGALTTGYGAAKDVYKNLGTTFGTTYKPGADAYGDASGANGAEGLARATGNFMNSGQYGVYGFANDQAQQALQRAHSAAGNLSSGNTDYDAMKTASGLAGNFWGQYQSGLAPYLQMYGTGATTAAAGEAGADTGLAAGLDASYRGQGTAANAMFTGQGKNDASAELNNYNVGANQLNALMGVGKFMAGGGLTNSVNDLSGAGKSLFGMFGGGA